MTVPSTSSKSVVHAGIVALVALVVTTCGTAQAAVEDRATKYFAEVDHLSGVQISPDLPELSSRQRQILNDAVSHVLGIVDEAYGILTTEAAGGTVTQARAQLIDDIKKNRGNMLTSMRTLSKDVLLDPARQDFPDRAGGINVDDFEWAIRLFDNYALATKPGASPGENPLFPNDLRSRLTWVLFADLATQVGVDAGQWGKLRKTLLRGWLILSEVVDQGSQLTFETAQLIIAGTRRIQTDDDFHSALLASIDRVFERDRSGRTLFQRKIPNSLLRAGDIPALGAFVGVNVDVPAGGGQPTVSKLSVSDGNTVRWRLSNAAARACDNGASAATLRVWFQEPSPSAGDAVREDAGILAKPGLLETTLRVTLRAPLLARAYAYYVQFLAGDGRVLCSIAAELNRPGRPPRGSPPHHTPRPPRPRPVHSPRR